MTEPRFLVPAILVSLALPVTGGADMDTSLQTLSRIMGVPASSITVNARPDQPHTSFQTPTGYMPENDIRTDAVIVYSSGKDQISTWKEKGYSIQTMYGFRTGDDYIKDHKDEGQTTADGTILTCGPGSYYMVPTQSRIDAAVAFYREAIKNGTADYHFIEVMACPGGCLGGGGQPFPTTPEIRMARAKAIYEADRGLPLRKSHENPVVTQLYEEFLGKPNGEMAHKLLHTHYTKRESNPVIEMPEEVGSSR